MTDRIDLKDKKILHELDFNSRQSFGSISSKVGLSKNSVIERVDNLQKNGVIKKFYSLIDLGKLGYTQFRIYFNIKNASPKKEEEIIDFLSKNKIVTEIESLDGLYNLGILIVSKNIYEVHELWDELLKKYVNYLGERLFTIIAKNYYYYKSYLLDDGKNEDEIEITTYKKIDDFKDIYIQLLKILAENSRARIIDLAEKLKITPKTVINYIKELEKKKVIVGYSALLDFDKIGYKMFRVSFLLFKLDSKKKEAFRDYAKSHSNIIYDEEVVGGDDYEIEIQVKDINDLREIISDIKSKFADIIQDYKVLHVFKEHKHLCFPEKI